MKNQTSMITLRKNSIKYMLRYIEEYEQVRDNRHSVFKTARALFKVRGICFQNFYKLYRRYVECDMIYPSHFKNPLRFYRGFVYAPGPHLRWIAAELVLLAMTWFLKCDGYTTRLSKKLFGFYRGFREDMIKNGTWYEIELLSRVVLLRVF